MALRLHRWKCHAPSFAIRHGQKRFVSDRFLQNTLNAEWAWKQQAAEIRAGKQKSMLKILEERGYINQIAGGRDELDNLLTSKRVGAYCGVDPTAPSLHVGHIVPFMALFWMYLHGFQAVTLLGGATVKLGDPTGRTTARNKLETRDRKANIALMHTQLKSLWMHVDSLGLKHGYQKDKAWKRGLLNNNVWMNKLPAIDIFAELGPAFRMGALLSRDSVKTRMESGDGMSFAEFSYPIVQAWDWWHMYTSIGIQLQIGGADQYGNIISGIDGVKHMAKNHPHQDVRVPEEEENWEPMGLTVPLLTTSSGEKFGKSAGNAVWLSQEMTSAFDLYAYLLSTPDDDVERLLKLLTFLPLSTISDVMSKHREAPEKRPAQHLLASEFLELAHGPQVAKQAAQDHSNRSTQRTTINISEHLSRLKAEVDESTANAKQPDWANVQSVSLNKSAPQTNPDNAPLPTITLPRSVVEEEPFPSILLAAGLVNSRSEGQRLINNKGAYVGGRTGPKHEIGDNLSWTSIRSTFPGAAKQWIVWGNDNRGVLLLRVGKWKIKLVNVIPDEEDILKGHMGNLGPENSDLGEIGPGTKGA